MVWNGGDVRMMVLRESIIMKIHYGTALGALFLTVIHIMMRLTQDFHESLEYENVIANYESVGYAILLELLLILISVHGFNGLRVILFEMNQGPTYEKVVTVGCLAGMAALIAYGSRTIIMTSMGMTIMATIHPKLSDELSQTVVSSTKSVKIKIKRSNPNVNSDEKFDDFVVPIEKWTTVLDVLLDVKSHLDHSVGVRYSCRQASCGSCGMKINGKPGLACFTKISELDSDTVTVEPMDNYPVVRDLAVNMDRMINNHKKVMPYVIREDSEIDAESGIREFLQSPENVDKYIQFSKLYQMWFM